MLTVGDELKRGRGRPKKESEPTRQYRLVMPEEDFSELERFCRITNMSKADFIREAIKNHEEKIEAERAAKFVYLTKNYNEEDYFDEYEEDFEEEF